MWQPIFWLHGQEVKTPPFHGSNPSSILGGVTNNRALCAVFYTVRDWRNWQTHQI